MARNPDWAFKRFYWKMACEEPRSRCQPQNCEEDDGYARKPRRQRKRAVRSGFPSRHWLILPLRLHASEEGVCLNGFSSWRTRADFTGPGRRDTSTPFGDSRCAIAPFERCATWLKKKNCFWELLLKKRMDAAEDVWRCIWGIWRCHLLIF